VSGVETKKPYYLVDLTVVDLVAEKRPVVVGRIFGDLFLVVVELESKVDIFFFFVTDAAAKRACKRRLSWSV
jgi:hypothetical protein